MTLHLVITLAITHLPNRIVGLHADSKPTTGNSNYRMFEELDTGNWFVWIPSTSTWQLMGNATAEPNLISTPTNAALVPSTLVTSDNVSNNANLPFQVILSTQPQPKSTYLGAHLYEADTQEWFRWSGAQWIESASPTAVIGTAQEKGGGQQSFLVTAASQSVFNIPHGIGAIPSIFMVCPANVFSIGQSATAANQGFKVTADATNIIVTYSTGVLTSTTVLLNWLARP